MSSQSIIIHFKNQSQTKKPLKSSKYFVAVYQIFQIVHFHVNKPNFPATKRRDIFDKPKLGNNQYLGHHVLLKQSIYPATNSHLSYVSVRLFELKNKYEAYLVLQVTAFFTLV